MAEGGAILHYTARPAHPRPSLLAQCLSRLSPQRHRVLEALATERCVDSLLGSALALSAARALGWPRDPGTIEYPDGGKPAWPSGPGFSIAHAAGLVACAMRRDGGAVGCDIEAVRTVAASDLRLVVDDEERALLETMRLSPAALWTCKEAALKWAGLGVRHATRPRVGVDGVALADRKLHCVTLDLPGGCIASVVADTTPEPLVLVAHEPLALLEAMATMP